MRRTLPQGFEPKLYAGKAIAGICLIRLEHIRPAFLPAAVGISSENAAHRVAVTWRAENNELCEGVFIPRRDSSSLMNHLAGGRLFPGEHHRARFDVQDDGSHIDFKMQATDGETSIELRGNVNADLPSTSSFGSLEEASHFFEKGSLGYSARARSQRLDGISLVTKTWRVEPLAIEHLFSSFFSDES